MDQIIALYPYIRKKIYQHMYNLFDDESLCILHIIKKYSNLRKNFLEE